MASTIILVEDDPVIRSELTHLLTHYGYEVKGLTDFSNPVEDILALHGQLVLLDLTLPQFDGFYIARELRQQSDIPIIVLTSRHTEMDELMSMQLGADDFVTKPFNSQILLARIQALLARTAAQTTTMEWKHDDFVYDMNRHVVHVGDEQVELTSNEHLILSQLLMNRGHIISREALMNHLWSNHAFVDDNTLTVNVNRVRRKLSQLGLDNIIQTKRGEGYMIA